MDTSEPSTNGISASNLYRLSSLLNDDTYAKKAKATVSCFEAEMLQYPWLFASFMPSIVAGQMGVRGVVVALGEEVEGASKKIKEFEKSPRGGLGTFATLSGEGGWLRSRNSLLDSFTKDGKTRIMICEGGVCKEEGLVEAPPPTAETAALDVSALKEALPTTTTETKPENKVEDATLTAEAKVEPKAEEVESQKVN
jgi:uncharacterized protein YyaL (SSP411 family)